MSSYNDALTLTPSDSADLPWLTDAINVGGSGVLACVLQNGRVVNIEAPEGVLPIKVKRVNSTNTTATALVALRRV